MSPHMRRRVALDLKTSELIIKAIFDKRGPALETVTTTGQPFDREDTVSRDLTIEDFGGRSDALGG